MSIVVVPAPPVAMPPIPRRRGRVFGEIHRERIRQHILHGDQTLASHQMPGLLKLGVTLEELGEVARALLDGHDPENLRAELVQVAACVVAWLESFPGHYPEDDS